MVFPTSSMNELNNKCSKKAAVFFFNRSRWTCSSITAAFSERRTIPDSSHPDHNTSFPSPCTPEPWLRHHLPSSITTSFKVSSSGHQAEIPNSVAYTVSNYSALFCMLSTGYAGEGRGGGKILGSPWQTQVRSILTTQQSEPNCLSLLNFFPLEINLMIFCNCSVWKSPRSLSSPHKPLTTPD